MSDDSDKLSEHASDEATPQQVGLPETPSPAALGLHDSSWQEAEWSRLLQVLVESGIVTWKDVTALVLGQLNPSQVGTSLASSDGFKRRYGKGNTMRVVMDWVYHQSGRCADCCTRLDLQADHIKGKEEYDDPLDADFIENMTLRCRRCNVVRRPSHEFGGLTFLTAEAALMWILLVIRPRTFRDYLRMCRMYGMTMADIRMQEAWAMAHWLARAEPPAYGIEDDAESAYDLVLWPDSAVTRVDPGASLFPDAKRIYSGVSGTTCLGFVIRQTDDRLKFYEYPVSFIPFSTYDLGTRPPQALCITYSPPDRKNKTPQRLSDLPPRGANVICHQIRKADELFELRRTGGLLGTQSEELGEARTQGKLIRTKIGPSAQCELVAVPRRNGTPGMMEILENL
jgi:hypothetical protein